MTTPPAIHDRLAQAFEAARAHDGREDADPVYLLGGFPRFVDIGGVKEEIGLELQGVHEKWAGVPLEMTSAYGLRVYLRGQSLRVHCDRIATHVISSVVHVANKSDEPWPLVIEDHEGMPHDVVLEPGQMVLYESAKCPHGRPTPFNGDYFTSLFLHFRPTEGWDYTLDDVRP